MPCDRQYLEIRSRVDRGMYALFTRRDFLKASGAGLLGLFLVDLQPVRVLAANITTQGRSTLSGIAVLNEPFFKAPSLRALRKDEVVDINAEIQGEVANGNPFNSVWYQIREGGYVFSGSLQPVEARHQKPVFDIPETGILGEVTVPFSDTRRASSVFANRGYRIYYSTTHWITGITVNRDEKSMWYEIYDRQTLETLFVPVHEMRVLSAAELSPLSPDIPEENKRIYVDLTTQTVTAFEGEEAVFSTRCASGARGSVTPGGEFRTYHKGPSIHMTNQGDGTENTYHLPGVPWVCFFTGTGVAFHGTYWHNDYGRPSSRGCVNLAPNDAKFIYHWSRPDVPVGTPYLNQPGSGTVVQVVGTTP